MSTVSTKMEKMEKIIKNPVKFKKFKETFEDLYKNLSEIYPQIYEVYTIFMSKAGYVIVEEGGIEEGGIEEGGKKGGMHIGSSVASSLPFPSHYSSNHSSIKNRDTLNFQELIMLIAFTIVFLRYFPEIYRVMIKRIKKGGKKSMKMRKSNRTVKKR